MAKMTSLEPINKLVHDLAALIAPTLRNSPGYSENIPIEIAETTLDMLLSRGLMYLPTEAAELRHMQTFQFVKSDIPDMAVEYIDRIEGERTDRLCSCEWIIHPEDVDKEVGSRRMHRGAPDRACVVHTKVGLILGFFVHVFNPDSPLGTPKAVTTTDAQKRTPREWAALEPRQITQNNGWTVGEWEAQEPCTYDEFFAKFSKCFTSERHRAANG